jgi:hypothetical protein
VIGPDYSIDMLCKVKEAFSIRKVQKVPWKNLWAATIHYVTIIVAIFWQAKVQNVVYFLLMSPWRDLDSNPEPRQQVVQPI